MVRAREERTMLVRDLTLFRRDGDLYRCTGWTVFPAVVTKQEAPWGVGARR